MSDSQLKYFHDNKIIWHCPKCFYETFARTNNVVSQLSVSVTELRKSMEKIDEINNNIPNIYQEFQFKYEDLNTKVEKIENKINGRSFVPSSSVTLTNYDVIANKQNIDHKQIIKKLFETVGVIIELTKFITQWNPLTRSIKVTFCDEVIANQLNNSDFRPQFKTITELRNATDVIITPNHVNVYDCIDRLNDLEIRELARDIKISGIPLKFNEVLTPQTESICELKSTVLQICQKFDPNTNLKDFNVRRIKPSQAVIVTFTDTHLRNEIFFNYIKHVSPKQNVTTQANLETQSTSNEAPANKLAYMHPFSTLILLAASLSVST